MAKWTFRYFGDPILREHSQPIEHITDEIKELAHFMIDFADNNNGIGLSAVQVGVLVRLFVLRDYRVLDDGRWVTSEPKVFINPRILWKSEEIESDQEGCMSIPGLQVGPIKRPVKVRIEALDLDGNLFIDEREGINARVSFHENDHLNGVLTIDRISPKARKKVEPALQAIRKKYST